MKPASRIQATIEILERGQLARVPLDTCVGDYMRVRRYIGAKDRSEIAERIYNVTRAHARLGWWLDKCNAPDTPRNRVIAWLCLGEKIEEKRFADLFDGSKFAPIELHEDESKIVTKLVGQDLSSPDQNEAVQVECPAIYEHALRNYFGHDFSQEMAAMLEPATLDLRVNLFLATREKVKNYLEADGVKTEETHFSPWGLRCKSKAFLSKTKAFGKGWIEIQDEGSQLIAYLCGAQPGMQVLDYCAGAGGKTLALASAMLRKGRVVAMDLDEKRLHKGKERYKKAQLADVIEVRPLSDERHKKWLKRQKGTFDITILDVPCTGSGTWRRNPDMRWRVFGPNIEELVTIQAEIMDKVAHTVKDGGKLVYATCSLFPEENEQQIEAFLDRHPEFSVAALPIELGLGTPYMRLTPLRHQTDGFFAAILIKNKDASL